MKIQIILCALTTSVLFSGYASESTNNFIPLENGFGYGQHSYESYPMHTAIWSGLQYQDSTGKKTDVWPYISAIWGPAVQITNNIVVLVGGKAEIYEIDGRERLRDRLIAFQAPSGPPLDITDQVLKKYSSESGIAFTNIVKDSFHSLLKTNGALQIDFVILKRDLRGVGSIDADGGTAIISWHDIETIMQDVKKNGKLKKEKWSGTEYLQKD
jgi:hypothetical protein